MVVAFEQYNIGAGFRGCVGGRGARRAAADYEDIALVVDGDVALRLTNEASAISWWLRAGTRLE